MKYIILFIFINLCYNSFSQITGTVKDDDTKPIDYVFIKVKGSTFSTVSDNQGSFKLEDCHINDTLCFYHLSYNRKEIVVLSNHLEVILGEKTQNLSEVMVSGNYAFELFYKCRLNTYNKLKNNYLSRSYWEGGDIINNDSVCICDIDFDIKQTNLNKIGKEANIKCSKVQEHVVRNASYDTKEWDLNFYPRVVPPENNFLIYKDFMDEYICQINEDSIQIKLLFIPKKIIKKGYNNVEVAIWKKSMCIDYIASCTAKSKQEYTKNGKISGNPIISQEVNVYLKYTYLNDYCYLSDFEMTHLFMYNQNNEKINRVQFSKYHVYEYNINQENQRTGKGIMEFNILKTTNNNFKSEFWKQKDTFKRLTYSYTKLRNADIY